MNELTGRIENITARSGFRANFEIQLAVSNSNDSPIEISWVSARSAIAFFDMSSQPTPAEQPRDLGFAFPSYNLPSISAGGRNTLVLALPVDAGLIAQLEDARKERDVTLYVYVNYAGVTRSRDGSLGSTSYGAVADEKFSGQAVLFIVPRSLWQQTIKRFSIPNIDALKDLSRIIAETRAAKTEAENAAKGAEEAAKAAKNAATLTAVTNLAQAYQEEADTFKKRSWIWVLLCIGIGTGIGWEISVFIKESLTLGTNFSVSIAILRAVVLAVTFGIFSLCLRVYESYRHLEVVNRHRVNIGRTFEAFKAAQPTERSQEIMSAITAENMLTFGKSGFAPKDSPNQSPLTDFSDLIKSILDKKS
jgi:hypothetical protein